MRDESGNFRMLTVHELCQVHKALGRADALNAMADAFEEELERHPLAIRARRARAEAAYVIGNWDKFDEEEMT